VPSTGSNGRRLREPDRLRHRRFEHPEVVGAGDGVEHRAGVRRAAVEQGGEDAEDRQRRVGEAADVVDGVEELPDPPM
jgi:hypothetical protein